MIPTTRTDFYLFGMVAVTWVACYTCEACRAALADPRRHLQPDKLEMEVWNTIYFE